MWLARVIRYVVCFNGVEKLLLKRRGWSHGRTLHGKTCILYGTDVVGGLVWNLWMCVYHLKGMFDDALGKVPIMV